MSETVSLFGMPEGLPSGPSEEIETEEIPSSKLEGYPGTLPNDFTPVAFITNKLIYDPSYIFKFKGPNMPGIIDKLNELVIAVTDLQQVVTDLVNNDHKETRNVMRDYVWTKVKTCCDILGVSYPYANLDDTWNGTGVLEEGIDPYTCHIIVK